MMKTRKGYPVYPLTVAQKFHLYYLPFCPNAAVLNIGTSLTIGTDLDWDVLRMQLYWQNIMEIRRIGSREMSGTAL